ncbi:unnamed protein product, partial [Phaeothamnion confervicola]
AAPVTSGGGAGGGGGRSGAGGCDNCDDTSNVLFEKSVVFVRCDIARIDADAPQRAEFASTKGPSGTSRQPCPNCCIGSSDLARWSEGEAARERTLAQTLAAIEELRRLTSDDGAPEVEGQKRSAVLGVNIPLRRSNEMLSTVSGNPLHDLAFDPHQQLGLDVFPLDAQGKWGMVLDFICNKLLNSSGVERFAALLVDKEIYGPGRRALRDPRLKGFLSSLKGMEKWLFAEIAVVAFTRFFALMAAEVGGGAEAAASPAATSAAAAVT